MRLGAESNKPETGFTLVEVILSLFIFSLIASSTLYAQRIGIIAKEQLEQSDAELRQLQITRLLIKEDMAQILLRRVRDEFGNNLDSAFLGGARANNQNNDGETVYLLRFVRDGWRNVEYQEPRAEIQYVEYLVRENQLIRRTRPFLDHAPDQRFSDRILLNNVSDIRFEFLSSFQRGEAQWIDTWPAGVGPLSSEGGASVAPAINLIMTTERLGELSQQFWIGRLGIEGGV